ncbi:CACNA1B [Symbiodinium sp. CCMP2592]|nr:CACNA1B [Symbiodinium sp. CCMP2592]
MAQPTAGDFQQAMQQMQGLAQRVTELTQELQISRQRESVLESRIEQSAHMTDLVRTIADGQTRMTEELVRSRGKELTLVDNRGVAKPDRFKGEESHYLQWKTKTESFIFSVFPELEKALEWAEEQEAAISMAQVRAAFGTGGAQGEIDGYENKFAQLYAVLQSLLEDEPFSIIRNISKGNGLEGWRKLARRYDPATGGRKKSLLKHILTPERQKLSELSAYLEQWMELVRRYEERRGAGGRAELPNDIKISILESICPVELEKHLQLNRQRLDTFEEVYDEIASYLETRVGIKLKIGTGHPSNPDAMDVGSFGKGGKKGKGKDKGKGKPKGKDKGKGKGGGNKGHDNNKKNDPNVCNVCGKTGHWARDCWYNKGPQGKKGGGKKGKGKGGKHGKTKGANSMEEAEGEEEPKQEPEAETGFLLLCALEKEERKKGSSSEGSERKGRESVEGESGQYPQPVRAAEGSVESSPVARGALCSEAAMAPKQSIWFEEQEGPKGKEVRMEGRGKGKEKSGKGKGGVPPAVSAVATITAPTLEGVPERIRALAEQRANRRAREDTACDWREVPDTAYRQRLMAAREVTLGKRGSIAQAVYHRMLSDNTGLDEACSSCDDRTKKLKGVGCLTSTSWTNSSVAAGPLVRERKMSSYHCGDNVKKQEQKQESSKEVKVDPVKKQLQDPKEDDGEASAPYTQDAKIAQSYQQGRTGGSGRKLGCEQAPEALDAETQLAPWPPSVVPTSECKWYTRVWEAVWVWYSALFFDPFCGTRVGEASHPGPGGLAAARRKKTQLKDTGLNQKALEAIVQSVLLVLDKRQAASDAAWWPQQPRRGVRQWQSAQAAHSYWGEWSEDSQDSDYNWKWWEPACITSSCWQGQDPETGWWDPEAWTSWWADPHYQGVSYTDEGLYASGDQADEPATWASAPVSQPPRRQTGSCPPPKEASEGGPNKKRKVDPQQFPELLKVNAPSKSSKYALRIEPSEWNSEIVLTTVPQIQKALEEGAELPGNLVVSRSSTCLESLLNLVDAFEISDTPVTVISAWASMLGCKVNELTGGTWETLHLPRGSCLSGHVRVPLALGRKAASLSGKRGLFSTLVSKGETKSPVAWMPLDQDVDDEQYFRVASASAEAQGWDVLSFCASPNVLILEWSEGNASKEDVAEFFESANWTEVEVLARRRSWSKNNTPEWVVKALPPEGSQGPSWSYSDVDSYLTIAEEPHRKKKPVESVKVQPPKKKWIDRPPNRSASIQPTQIDLSDDDEESASETLRATGATTAKAETRARSRSPKKEKSKPAKHVAAARKFTPDETLLQDLGPWLLQEAGGTGDCGYRATATALQVNQGKPALTDEDLKLQASTLRLLAVTHMSKHKKKFEESFSPDPDECPDVWGGHEAPGDFDSYLKLAPKREVWIDELQLRSLAERLGSPIVVWAFNSSCGTWLRSVYAPFWANDTAQAAKKQRPIVLALRDRHYRALVPADPAVAVPESWLWRTEYTGTDKLRGAGALSEALSVSASTPRRALSLPGSTPKRCQPSSLPSATPSCPGGSGSFFSQGSSRGLVLGPKPGCFSSEDPVPLPKGASGCSSGSARAAFQGQKRKAALSLPCSTPIKAPSLEHTGEDKNRANLSALLGPNGLPKRLRIIGKCKGFRCLGSACRPSTGPSASSHSDIANLNELEEGESPESDSRLPTAPSTSSGPGTRPIGSDNPPWTCPSCDIVLRAPCHAKLREMVWNHWCVKHVGEKMPPNCLFRQKPEPAVASANIPQDQRDWECPICRVGLPKLDRNVKTASIELHRSSVHPRMSRKRMYAKRWHNWKEVQYLKEGRSKISDKLKAACDRSSSTKEFGGHDVRRLDAPDLRSGRGRYLTCSKCRLRGHAITTFTRVKCLGKPVPVTGSSRTWWAKHRSCDVKSLLAAWKVSFEQADSYFGYVDCEGRLPNAPILSKEQAKGHVLCYVDLGEHAESSKSTKVLSCLRCRFIRHNLSRLIECRGPSEAPHPLQCRFWHERTSPVKKIMCRAWNCTVRDANRFFKAPKPDTKAQSTASLRSCRIGEASNPGPSSAGLGKVSNFSRTRPVFAPKGRAGSLKVCRVTQTVTKAQLTAAYNGVRFEASHPGPTQASPSGQGENVVVTGEPIRPLSAKVVSCNVGGTSGAYAAVKEWLSTDVHDVVLLQELCMSDAQWSTFQRKAQRWGFQAYYQKGGASRDGWGNPTVRGGIAVFASKRLSQRLVFSDARQHSQLLIVAVGGVHFGSMYAPPGYEGLPQDELCELLTLYNRTDLAAAAQRWIIGGDLNEEFSDSAIIDHAGLFGGQALRLGRSTRWDSNREIDFFLVNRPAEVQALRAGQIRVSEHVSLHTSIQLRCRESRRGMLRTTPDFSKPSGVTAKRWRQLLDEAWQANPEVPSFLSSLSGPVHPDEEWWSFQGLLQAAFLEALRRAKQEATADSANDLDLRLRTAKGHKGRPGQHLWLQWSSRGPELDTASFQLRKKRKALARACELSRLRRSGLPQEDPQVVKLLRRLPIQKADLGTLELFIRNTSSEVQKQTLEEKRAAISRWKRNMIEDPKALGKWLRSKEDPAPACLVNEREVVAESLEQGATFVRTYWESFWQKHSAHKPSEDEVYAVLRQGLPQCRPVDIPPPSAQELLRHARAQKGSCGPDGWTGSELAHLSIHMLDAFRRVAMRWHQASKIPEALHHIRMVSLPKPGKAFEGKLKVSDTRPISVLNTFWRLWITTWTKSDGMKTWVSLNLPPEIRARAGQAVPAVASSILEEFHTQGLLLSLDWSKCFDTLSPVATTRIMQDFGLPKGLADICCDLWTHQVRWISWSGTCCEQPLHTKVGVPQGDPLGPLVTALWATCGSNLVKQRLPEHVRGDAKTSVFVDDRTVVASKPETIVASKREWFRWSSQVGLVENERKVVVAAATAAKTRVAEDFGLAEFVKPYAKVLGVCTAAKSRTSTEEEKERLGKTLRTLRLLATAQLPFRQYHAAVATYAMPKASYGWFGRRPTQAETWKLWAQVRRGDGVCRLANKFIRGILLGGCSHLELLATRHLLSAVTASDDRSVQRWNGPRGHPVHTLRGSLLDQGWSVTRPWVLEHSSGHRLDLRIGRLPHAKAAHVLREGWRAHLFGRFLQSDRHETSEWHALPDWRPLFRKVALEPTRKWLFSEPAARTVALLAAASPAWNVPGSSDRCIWGCGALGSWDHICWQCPLRPCSICKPSSTFLSRLGWTVDSGHASRRAQVWLVQVVKAIWADRHDGSAV